MNLNNFFRLSEINYYNFRIHFMFDDTSPKLKPAILRLCPTQIRYGVTLHDPN